jgi:uncharacterized iron-regulated membrane protein
MSIRKIIFWAHLLTGLTIGAVILVKAVTGTLLAFKPQIVNMAERSLQTVPIPSPMARRLDIDTLVETAKAADPKQKFSGITLRSDPAASAFVSFGQEADALYMNPYTAELLGKPSLIRGVLREVEYFHRWFGVRSLGRPISGAAAFLFFFMVLLGTYLWWPSIWTKPVLESITTFRGGLRGKARNWNWHNVIGFWSMPFLIVISLTGVVMSYQWADNLLYRVTGNEPPPEQAAEKTPRSEGKEGQTQGLAVEVPVEAPRARLDALWAQAELKVPAWFSINLRVAATVGEPVTLFIQEADTSLGVPHFSQLKLDAATGAVVKWESFQDLNSGRKARQWAHYLHTGEAGGWVGQLIALLVACGAAMLVWTGLAMAWHRFRRWRATTG